MGKLIQQLIFINVSNKLTLKIIFFVFINNIINFKIYGYFFIYKINQYH